MSTTTTKAAAKPKSYAIRDRTLRTAVHIEHLKAVMRGINVHHDHLYKSGECTELMTVAMVQLKAAHELLRIECDRVAAGN